MPKKKKKTEKVRWWAATDEIKSMGPFRSQLEAWEALRMTPELQKREGRTHPRGAYVYPATSSAHRRNEVAVLNAKPPRPAWIDGAIREALRS
jgi:hypothetical protein